jgi:ferredoxin--NADP+ reductase
MPAPAIEASSSPAHGFAAHLVAREDLTDDLALFHVAPEGRVPPFRAGQWMKLGVRDRARDGALVWRPYTVASTSRSALLTFYVRRVWKPGPGKLTTLLWGLQRGDEVRWQAARGAFTLERWRAERKPRALLLLAGGTGLAPFVAQLEELVHEGAPTRVVLAHGVSYADELGFRARFEQLAASTVDDAGRPWSFEYLPTVSRPDHPRNRSWRGQCGRVEALLASPADTPCAVERALGRPLAPADVFVLACGYARTVDNLLAALHARGFTGPRAGADGTLDVLVDSFGADESSSRTS